MRSRSSIFLIGEGQPTVVALDIRPVGTSPFRSLPAAKLANPMTGRVAMGYPHKETLEVRCLTWSMVQRRAVLSGRQRRKRRAMSKPATGEMVVLDFNHQFGGQWLPLGGSRPEHLPKIRQVHQSTVNPEVNLILIPWNWSSACLLIQTARSGYPPFVEGWMIHGLKRGSFGGRFPWRAPRESDT